MRQGSVNAPEERAAGTFEDYPEEKTGAQGDSRDLFSSRAGPSKDRD